MDYYPHEWTNEEQMHILMGPLPPIDENVRRNSRISFWSNAIRHWCLITKTLTFDIKDAEAAFQRENCKPMCLFEVLSCMKKQGELMPIGDFDALDKESWKEWTKNVFAKPFKWTWLSIEGYFKSNTEVLVDIILLKTMTTEVLERCWQSASGGTITTLGALYCKVSDIVGSSDNLKLVIAFLAKQGKACFVDYGDTAYVKLIDIDKKVPPLISESELAEEHLKSAKANMDVRIKELSEEVEKYRVEAKILLHKGLKVQALSMLREKKRIEKSLESQLLIRDNVLKCLLELQDSRMNKSVVNAMKLGLLAIEESIRNVSPDSASLVMDEIAEALEQCSEIGNTLAFGSADSSFSISEEELNEELARLTVSTPDDLSLLPNVPEDKAALPEEKTPFELAL